MSRLGSLVSKTALCENINFKLPLGKNSPLALFKIDFTFATVRVGLSVAHSIMRSAPWGALPS